MKHNSFVYEKRLKKYITFFSCNRKIDNNEKEITKTVSDRSKFIDSARFMGSLSNLVDNLAKCANCSTCCREYTNAKDNLIE